MKKSKIIAAAVLSTVLGAQASLLVGCGSGNNKSINGESFTMPEIKDYTTYNNGDFSDYSPAGTVNSELLPDQWLEYGAGDPFLYRFNGMYYLYVSTRDNENGVLAWKSSDMIHWTKCRGAGLKDGYVSEDPVSTSAYAPEVYYFNGKFYMYTSPAGHGHFTLVADDPEGPFVRITENYGMSIDASVFMDDDETIYFLNAGQNGIDIHKMDSFDSVPGRAVKLEKTGLGWTEGPMLIKNNGYYYLTFTGINVTSPAYRVSYVSAKDGDNLTRRDSFNEGVNNPVLLDVDIENNFKGLGHSSTVLGPDMDSRYICYHTLNALTDHGPWRSMNIDRLVFNGSQMSVDASKTDSIAARLPVFSAPDTTDTTKFETVGSKVLSVQATSSVFTAEYNFTGNAVKCIAGYADENNYVYAAADYTAKTVSLHKVSGGADSIVTTGTLKNDFDPAALHTVRIAYADGKCDVYFDNMRKISDASIDISSGKIGYDGGSAKYTAFSDVAKGYSDRVELKQSGSAIGASNYLPAGAYDGVTSYKLGNGSGLSTVEVNETENPDDISYDGAYKLTLANSGDFARYAAYFRKSGHYGLTVTYEKKYAGRAIGIQVNGGDVQTVTLPDVPVSEDDYWCSIVSATVGELDVEAGANIITIYGGDSEVGFISFTAVEKAYGNYEFINDLRDVVDRGALYKSMYRIIDDGHATRSGNRMLAYFGDGTIADCEMEVKMRFLSENIYSAGIILRAGNYATSNYDYNTSIQGYYIGILNNLVTLSKYNFNYTSTNLRFENHGVTENVTEHWFRIRVVVKGNTMTVYVDEKEMFSYTDPHPFTTGYFGLYSEGAEVVYKNLIIRGL